MAQSFDTFVGVSANGSSPGQSVDFDGATAESVVVTNNSGISIQYSTDASAFTTVTNGNSASLGTLSDPTLFRLRKVASDSYPVQVQLAWTVPSASSGGGGTFATQAEAEAGVNTTAYMNPLRTSQAIAALGAAGTVTLTGSQTLTNKTLTAPTLTAPVLGTPASGTLTNCTGLPVAGGGTGRATGTTAYALVATGTTATGAQQSLAAGATTEILVGGGASALPVWTTATGSGSPVRATSPTISAVTLSGITTADGANVTTANAMGALAIDVTKGLNTKSIAADSTFTFSGTPATANTWFGVYITNTDTNPHIITFPSAFSQVTQAARTTCPIAASGQLYLMFRYDGSGYKVFGDGPYLNKFDATAAPAVGDDIADGYGAGSFWYNATGNALYICESNGAGAAVWTAVGGGGSGNVSNTGTPTSGQVAEWTNATTVQGVAVTGTGSYVKGTSPTLVTPVLGTPTSGNLSACTADGTDAVGFRNVPANSQSAAYTCVLADAGKSIDHPSTDANARAFTIPANASVAYPVGTCLSFSNMTSQVVTIAITTDTMYLAGAGTTGSRSLAQYGVATARKLTSTTWLINGTGLT